MRLRQGVTGAMVFVGALGITALVAGRQQARVEGRSSQAAHLAPDFTEQDHPAARIDLRAVMEQVHYAFRNAGGAWRGGHATYEVARLPDGALRMVPFHQPTGSGAGGVPPAPSSLGSGRDERGPPKAARALQGSPVEFAPARIARGRSVLAADAGEAAGTAKGQLVVARGSVKEHLGNGPGGVEQSWRLAERPRGEGDLEVRITLTQGRFLAESESGLHFSGGTLAVRFGHGTWIDAAGFSTPVPARWDGGGIVLRVPAAVVDGSHYPAVLDPIMSPELQVDVPVYGATTAFSESWPAVASDGSDYLVVWGAQWPAGLGYDILGARVSGADGRVLDGGGIPIATVAGEQWEPAVAWGGTCYLVAWSDQRSGSGYADIYGARVAADGAVLDPSGIPVAVAQWQQERPAVAWDGTRFLVVWEDQRSGSSFDIHGARVSGSDGAVLDPSGIAISTAANLQDHASVAWDGTNFLVAWRDFESFAIRGARVSGATGAVLDGTAIAISTAAGNKGATAVASDGSSSMVVWENGQDGDGIYGARVKPDGTVLDPSAIAIAATPSGFLMDPAVAWDGTRFVVAWTDLLAGGVACARVEGDGTVLDPLGITVTTTGSDPAVAASSSGSLLAWNDNRNGPGGDIFAARMTGDGAPLDGSGIAVSNEPNRQLFPAVASDGTDYLVVWQDERAGSDVYGARVSGATGALLDPSGIAISVAEGDQVSPVAAWSGSDYLVAWNDTRTASGHSDIYAARVSASGSVIDPSGLLLFDGPGGASVSALAWGGESYLVVWTDLRNLDDANIFGARVAADGTVLDSSGIAITTAPWHQTGPAVAWGGGNFLVTWTDGRTGMGALPDVYAARVRGSDGSVLDPGGVVVSAATNSQRDPTAAWNGANYLVVWSDHRSGTSTDVYGARVGGSGAILDPAGIPIATGAGHQVSPALAWDGARHLAIWGDTRGGTGSDVYGARVTAAGTVLDPGGFLLSDTSVVPGAYLYGGDGPALATAGNLRFLVAYEGYGTVELPRNSRIQVRSVALQPSIDVAQSVTTSEDMPVGITLAASGVSAPTFTVVAPPLHGTLTGSGADLTYTPDADFSGQDVFTFTVTDGATSSDEAAISLAISPVNDPPVASAQSVTVAEDGSVAIALGGTDVEGDSLTFDVVALPAHGTLLGTGAARTYAPDAGFAGLDSFTFTANDGAADSAPAIVNVTVIAAEEPALDGGCGCRTNGGAGTTSGLLIALLGLWVRRSSGSGRGGPVSSARAR